jgi:heat shock protein HtpX
MFIINPLQASGAGGGSLFSTHPPTSERVRILRSMAGASLADYEAAFRKARGAGLISAESLQGTAAQAIRPPSDEGPVQTRGDMRGLVASRSGYLSVRCACGVDLAVPPGCRLSDVRCVRCGRGLELPAATAPAIVPPLIAAPPIQAPSPPLQYTRRGPGWESFRCGCGQPVQLSPAFAGSRMRCAHCGREIEIVSRAAAS